ncbi:type III-B CRISPR module-associated protein Cmr5 [Allochromatium vinosum]|uniref:type III-B CRISPR module-associated protein Cmr5 n=1 Tax=Allochromatium vinosum TaxID=1049 RepID=UPI0019036881|nr:type III-B CRISPR module-associated protein Cmr5 [Allochromatium vinosum]MBK1656456.1 type III-B CRISPR module-associated protein Cmr5 [Allochromatium vinosum]
MAKNYAKEQRRLEKEREKERQAAQAPATPVTGSTKAVTTSPSAPPPRHERAHPMSSQPPLATPEQQRAAFALKHIQALRDEWQDKPKEQKEFNSHASAMPFMIRANGLGQTAAFYRRKGTDHVYYRLYELLGDWLAELECPFSGQRDLLTAITQSDQDAYLAAQIEALLFLDWVKKLASAFLAREDDADEGRATP